MRRLAPLLGTLALLLATTVDAQAQYDLSGRWFVSGAFIILGEPDPYTSRHWDVVQSAGTLSVTMTDEDGNMTGPYSGTINETTGAFAIGGIEGTVAADSLTFSASRSGQICGLACIETETTYNGSRCGNGSIDGDEECDDDNGDSGDCCLPSCIADKRGAACPSDDNACTDDVCDGDGVCEHESNSASCSGGVDGCSMGTCSAGSCVISSPSPAGASCDIDGDHCTADTCDGAGACTAGGPLDCAPCGICDSDLGCIAEYASGTCEDAAHDVALKISAGPASRRRISLEYDTPQGAGPGGMDPTLDTSYTFCVYRQEDTGWPKVVLFAATVDPGGVCGGDPCWQEDGHGGFRYRNKDRTPHGIESIKNKVHPMVAMKGRKELLDLPTELPALPGTFYARIIMNDGVSTRCWMNPLQTEQLTTKKYKGRL